jgi:hypothetical protein
MYALRITFGDTGTGTLGRGRWDAGMLGRWNAGTATTMADRVGYTSQTHCMHGEGPLSNPRRVIVNDFPHWRLRNASLSTKGRASWATKSAWPE